MKKDRPAAAPPIETNRDLMHLAYAETRLNGLRVNAPGSDELARISAAREEILARISTRDLAAFRKATNLKEAPGHNPIDAVR